MNLHSVIAWIWCNWWIQSNILTHDKTIKAIKQSKLLVNTKLHINKIIRKEIMKRSRLKNTGNRSSKDIKAL